jgi:hypothetical protein
MAYNLMLSQIKQGKKTKAFLTTRANVFFMAGQLAPEEYAEIMELINAME